MNMIIVDRRLNPKGKSLGNRQRFLRRARVEVKSRGAGGLAQAQGRRCRAWREGRDPDARHLRAVFRHTGAPAAPITSSRATRSIVRGDEIQRPQGGEGQGGREGSPDGRARTSSSSRSPRKSSSTCSSRTSSCPTWSRRASRTRPRSSCSAPATRSTGTPANLSVLRTMRNSMGRRIALQAAEAVARSRRCAQAVEEARARGDDEEAERLRQGARAASSGAARSSPTSIRSTCATAASTACRCRPPRR